MASIDVVLADLRSLESTLPTLYDTLDADERARATRFQRQGDRLRAIASFGLRRAILGARLHVAPAVLEFTYGGRGKPALRHAPPLHFSVAHSGDLFAIAMGRVGPIGIDVERRRPIDVDRLAERFFAHEEQNALRCLAEEPRAAAFFACWTRKEAVVKATGEGIDRPLHEFAVPVGIDAAGPLLRGDPSLRLLRVYPLDVGEGYAGALATKGSPHVRTVRIDAHDVARMAATKSRALALVERSISSRSRPNRSLG